ncbi:MAG: zf-HC2 domain-containing protein [Actinomycetota bacterium]
MDCERALEELEAYLDGELAEPSRAELERHLFGCASCFDRGEFRMAVREIVRRKCGVEAELPQRVVVRIRRLISGEIDPR